MTRNTCTNGFPSVAFRQTPVPPQPLWAMHHAMPTRYTDMRLVHREPGLLHPMASVLGLMPESGTVDGCPYQRAINRHTSGTITGTSPLYDANG